MHDNQYSQESNQSVQCERAHLFKSLHNLNNPLILVNIWDAGSAKTLEMAGAKAIATSSWSVATAHGYADGEKLPLNLVLENLKRIIPSANLPVTIDLESGYGENLVALQETIHQIIQLGAVGINFEDQIIGQTALYSIEEQCARLEAIRAVAEQMFIPLFINARTDIFLKAEAKTHHEHHVKEALNRAFAYAKAGADGFFVPGLENKEYIQKICASSPLPVNIMASDEAVLPEDLAELGVSRISYGPIPYLKTRYYLESYSKSLLTRTVGSGID